MQDVDHARKTDAVIGNRMSGRRSSFAFTSFLFSFSINDLHDNCFMQAVRVRELMGRWLSFLTIPPLHFLHFSPMSLCPCVILPFSTITTYLTLPADCCYPRNLHDERRAPPSIAIIHCPLISFVSLEMTFTVRLLPHASFCGLLSRFMTHQLMPLDLSLQLQL